MSDRKLTMQQITEAYLQQRDAFEAAGPARDTLYIGDAGERSPSINVGVPEGSVSVPITGWIPGAAMKDQAAFMASDALVDQVNSAQVSGEESCYQMIAWPRELQLPYFDGPPGDQTIAPWSVRLTPQETVVPSNPVAAAYETFVDEQIPVTDEMIEAAIQRWGGDRFASCRDVAVAIYRAMAAAAPKPLYEECLATQGNVAAVDVLAQCSAQMNRIAELEAKLEASEAMAWDHVHRRAKFEAENRALRAQLAAFTEGNVAPPTPAPVTPPGPGPIGPVSAPPTVAKPAHNPFRTFETDRRRIGG